MKRKMGGAGQPGLPRDKAEEDGAKPLKRARGRPAVRRTPGTDAPRKPRGRR